MTTEPKTKADKIAALIGALLYQFVIAFVWVVGACLAIRACGGNFAMQVGE